MTPTIKFAIRKLNEGMEFSNWYETNLKGFIKNKYPNNVWQYTLKWILKVSGSFSLFILIKHLYLGDVWLAENFRLNIKKTCVLKRLDYVFNFIVHFGFNNWHNQEDLCSLLYGTWLVDFDHSKDFDMNFKNLWNWTWFLQVYLWAHEKFNLVKPRRLR